MKTALLFLLILAGAVSAVAQPTLTAATTNPLAGETFYGFDCDTTGVSLGASGPAVTWDLSGLARVDTDSIVYVACAGTPYCDSFPGSTLAYNDGFGYEYFITDAVKFAISGYGITGNSIYYSDPQNLISYPSTYGTVGADSYYSTEPGDSDYNYGVDSFYADAWGTLILPSGTYPNTLRLHYVDYSVDSSISMGIPFVDSEKSEFYLWFTPGFHNPLLEIDIEPATGGGSVITGVTYYTDSLPYPSLASTGVAGISNAGSSVQVYPNPANEVLHIILNSQANELATLTVTDMAGRKMDGTTSWVSVTKGVNNLNYDVSFLPPGMYLLQVHTDENTVNKKIFIAR